MSQSIATRRHSQTGRALMWTNLLNEPLFTLYGFLAFILYKDLGASPFQIALMAMLKPVITILSFYWSSGLGGRKKLKPNVLWAGFFMRAPFLLCPWIDSSWYVIASAVNYMFFYRAGQPAWLEILRKNIGKGRERAFSVSAGLGYVEGVALSLGMGALLDQDPTVWRGLLCGAAILGFLSLMIQSRIEVDEGDGGEEEIGLREKLVRPWRDSWQLIRKRPDFAKFQWGFMICGFGVMLIQPALPLFAVDSLGISYLEMAAAVSIAKGLGFAFSSGFWGRWMERESILKVSSAVFLTFALFPLILCLSVWGAFWLYVAYFWYGVGQGGSHLVWNMFGPIFAGKEESSRYS